MNAISTAELAAITSPMTKPLNLLLLEDSQDDELLLLRQLKKEGYETHCRRIDREQALREALQQEPWDLIISDYSMPNFSGLQAIKILKDSELDIPFILVSGAIGEETAVEALKEGAKDFILKSNLSRLATAIQRELQEAKERQALREAELVRKQLETDLAAAKALAEAANQRKSQVLAFVAHEFKNPLNAVMHFADMMAKGHAGELTEQQLQYIQHMMTGIKHLRDLMEDILDIASIEAGKIPLAKELLCVNELLVDVQWMVEHEVIKSALTLTIKVEDSIQEIEADPKRLRQILINLLSNAIKYNRPGGEVQLIIEYDPSKTHLLFIVKDNGIGISPEELTKLFTDFYRVNNSLSTQREGLGLGLSLTKRLVEIQGGTLEVESIEGQGSTFIVKLPVL